MFDSRPSKGRGEHASKVVDNDALINLVSSDEEGALHPNQTLTLQFDRDITAILLLQDTIYTF